MFTIHSEVQNSVYIRLTGTSNNPVIYKDDYDFKIGEAIKLKEETILQFLLLAEWFQC